MRLALPGSALVHGTIVAALFIGFAWPKQDDAPAGMPVTVDIVSLSAVSANSTETVESDASETLVSVGAETASAMTSEALAPLDSTAMPPVTETLQPSEPVTTQAPLEPQPAPELTEPQPAEPAEIVELASVAHSEIPAIAAEALTIEPVREEELNAAPVPRILSIARTSTPTYPERPAQPKPPASPPPPPRQQAAPAGNGGASTADAVASNSGVQQGNEGAGGEAAVSQYTGQVLSKLRRALRYPRDADGASGEVHVQFVVAANGSATSIQIVRSSGNAAIDEGGIATVNRAAPFPAIPSAANRNSWTFTVPLAFQR